MNERNSAVILLWMLGALLVWLAVGAFAVWADETYAPATPIAPVEDVIAGYKVIDLNLHTSLDGGNAQVYVMVQPFKADGTCARDALKACRQIQVTYDAGDATNLLNILNTANLTNNSLRKRVLAKLAADGFLPSAGQVTGTVGIPTLPTPAPTATPG